MDNNNYLTWEEIKTKYPDSWVSIIEPESVEGEGLKRGIVIGHNKDRKTLAMETKALIEEGLDFKLHTLVYTGEIPYLVGICKLELHDVQS